MNKNEKTITDTRRIVIRFVFPSVANIQEYLWSIEESHWVRSKHNPREIWGRVHKQRRGNKERGKTVRVEEGERKR